MAIPGFSDMHIIIQDMSIDDFLKLDLDDVNYSGVLFIFEKRYSKQVYNKIINDWELNKSYRIDQVMEDHMFYVENCDIQTIDGKIHLFEMLFDHDDIDHICVIGKVGNIDQFEDDERQRYKSESEIKE